MSNAIGALRKRVFQIESSMGAWVRERDRYQQTVDRYQQSIDEGVAEINSINAALELLEAAKEYNDA